ncbi:MAG: HEAT repeat domain-containing protein [Armatimonadetes bacterium]|nr:HEAT repeat domain-containing protein [Armatimonadota bacterium]MDW8027172.1 HEAT repeat domain-containing protein [Armatimonadota bacterium]
MRYFVTAIAIVAALAIFGCGESEQAKKAKVSNWVAQLKANPSLAEKEEFRKQLEDYADIAAPEFAKLLKDSNEKVVLGALRVLAHLKRLTVIENIAAATKSPSIEIRKAAAQTLGVFGSPLAVKPLMEMLNDPVVEVRAAALEALAGPGGRDAPPFLNEVLPYLVEGLNDPNPQVRQAAVNGLVKLGQWSLQAIAKVRSEGSPIAREEAEKAYLQICEGFRKDLRENSDRLIRRDMARYIGELRYAKATSDLIDRLQNDADPEVRSACAYALGNIKAKFATGPLREVMENEKEEMPVRLSAAVALGQMGNENGIQFLIDQLKSSDEKIRSSAVEALRTIGKPATNLLIKAAQSKDPLQRWGAVAALGETGEPKAVPILLRALRDEDENVRAVAAASLGKLRYARAAPQLIRALADKSERVQAHAEWALENIGEEAIPAIMEGAKKTATKLRAFRLLGRLKAKEAVPVLIEGLNDRKPEIRSMAAWALGEIGDQRAVEALERTLDDKVDEVRREAALALGKLGAEKILRARLSEEKSPIVRTAINLALQGM